MTMENTIKLLEELRDIVKVAERNIAYVSNSLQRIITEAKGSLQQSHKSAEDWLKKHNYVDSGIEWNPLTSTNEGMRVSISSVLDQFVSSQQPTKSAEDSGEKMKYRSIHFDARKPTMSANVYFYIAHSGAHTYGYYHGYCGHMENHLKDNPTHSLTWLEPESEYDSDAYYSRITQSQPPK
jgi:hypothetical protein